MARSDKSSLFSDKHLSTEENTWLENYARWLLNHGNHPVNLEQVLSVQATPSLWDIVTRQTAVGRLGVFTANAESIEIYSYAIDQLVNSYEPDVITKHTFRFGLYVYILGHEFTHYNDHFHPVARTNKTTARTVIEAIPLENRRQFVTLSIPTILKVSPKENRPVQSTPPTNRQHRRFSYLAGDFSTDNSSMFPSDLRSLNFYKGGGEFLAHLGGLYLVDAFTKSTPFPASTQTIAKIWKESLVNLNQFTHRNSYSALYTPIINYVISGMKSSF